MTYLILGMGTGELLILLSIIILPIWLIRVIFRMGKNAGENKVYKEIYKRENTAKSKELLRLEKLLTDKIISQEEFETLKNKLK
jgi:uncharacterized membrane protein